MKLESLLYHRQATENREKIFVFVLGTFDLEVTSIQACYISAWNSLHPNTILFQAMPLQHLFTKAVQL